MTCFELYLSWKCSLKGLLEWKRANFEQIATKCHRSDENITLSFEPQEKCLAIFFFFSLSTKKPRGNQNFVRQKWDLVGGGLGLGGGGIQKILVGGGGSPPSPPLGRTLPPDYHASEHEASCISLSKNSSFKCWLTFECWLVTQCRRITREMRRGK